MKNILIITFLSLTNYLYSQDTIRTISGNLIIAKVTEVNINDIKYKKYNNIEGPNYVLSKQEIHYITYQNGDKEIYFNKEERETISSEINNDKLFVILTKKNNKVYIDSENKNAIIHATSAILKWGYWEITQNKNEADFILNFNIRFAGLGDAFCYAQFINPKNGKTIKITKEVNTITSWDMNTKRGAINKVIAKEIKPMIYNSK